MKTLLYILALSSALFANVHLGADQASCVECHQTITKEFESSMHKNSSIYADKVHNAVWNKHPLKAKGNYKCAKCHTPNATTKEQQKQGIRCIECHTIKSLTSSDKKNLNNSSQNMCMSCHAINKNAHNFELCRTDGFEEKNTKQNCITCHMPKVGDKEQHTFHGFAGARKHPQMLSKYVTLGIAKDATGFEISVKNEAPHTLLTHPLRVVQLRATLTRDSKKTKLKTHTFVRIIGRDGKPSMPWAANQIVKDNMIKGKEKRTIRFDEKLQSGDKIKVSLGFFVVNPKAIKKLNLENEKELKKFTILKSQFFYVK